MAGNFNVTNPSTVGILAFMMAGHLMDVLTKKGLLTVEEGAEIYRQALQGVGPDNKEEARNILKFMLPDLRTDIP
jgi:hypothetical protein